MKKEASLELHIRELEERLFQPGIWRSTEGMSDLLADEFIEFGSSGRIYSKQHVIDIRRRDPAPNVSIADFRLRLLGRDVMMATYRVEKSIPGEEGSARSLRS